MPLMISILVDDTPEVRASLKRAVDDLSRLHARPIQALMTHMVDAYRVNPSAPIEEVLGTPQMPAADHPKEELGTPPAPQTSRCGCCRDQPCGFGADGHCSHCKTRATPRPRPEPRSHPSAGITSDKKSG